MCQNIFTTNILKQIRLKKRIVGTQRKFIYLYNNKNKKQLYILYIIIKLGRDYLKNF